MARAALRCAGKYLRGSGAEEAFIESRIFGPKILESVLSGGHYYRSFNGLVILGDAITRLKIEAFWAKYTPGKSQGGIEKLKRFQVALSSRELLHQNPSWRT